MRKFAFGSFGALLPDIVLLYSKRYTAQLLAFDLFQYGMVTAFYVISAGLLATIFPYRGQYTPWKAVVVGITLPVIVSSVIALADRSLIPTNENIEIRGGNPGHISPDYSAPGTLIDLMKAF